MLRVQRKPLWSPSPLSARARRRARAAGGSRSSNSARFRPGRQGIERARRGGIDTSKPIIVVAHSLGGLVVVDMLLKGDLQAKRLVTCGSQPAMFHVLKQLPSLPPYAPGKSSRVSANIASWTHLWHPMDVLAFVASPVFALHDGTGPTDIRIDTPLSTIIDDELWMHSAYWKGDELVEAVVG